MSQNFDSELQKGVGFLFNNSQFNVRKQMTQKSHIQPKLLCDTTWKYFLDHLTRHGNQCSNFKNVFWSVFSQLSLIRAILAIYWIYKS